MRLLSFFAGIYYFADYFDVVNRFEDYTRRPMDVFINPLAKIDQYDGRGWQAIHFAVEQGNFEATKTLIESFNADVNSKTILNLIGSLSDIPPESTPLIISIMKGHLEIFQYLISCSADMNAKTGQLKTPLHFAAESDNLVMIETLISRDAKIEYLRGTHQSPFHVAMEAGQFEAAKFFADRNLGVGAVCHGPSKIFEFSVHFLARQRLPADIWMKMLSLCAGTGCSNRGISGSVERRTMRGLTPLQVALEEGNDVAIAGLIVSGAELKGANSEFLDSLNIFLNGNPFSLDYLNPENETIWHFCARHNAKFLVQVSALTSKANLRSYNSQGLNALDLAFEEDRLDVALELIRAHEHVIDFEVLERLASKATLFFWDRIVEALIDEFSSDFSNMIADSSSALLLHSLATAPTLGSTQNPAIRNLVLLLVKNYPQIINKHDEFGRTPLHLALECDFEEFFSWLDEVKQCNSDLDFNVKDGDGRAFFDLLAEKYDQAILKVLNSK